MRNFRNSLLKREYLIKCVHVKYSVYINKMFYEDIDSRITLARQDIYKGVLF